RRRKGHGGIRLPLRRVHGVRSQSEEYPGRDEALRRRGARSDHSSRARAHRSGRQALHRGYEPGDEHPRRQMGPGADRAVARGLEGPGGSRNPGAAENAGRGSERARRRAGKNRRRRVSRRQTLAISNDNDFDSEESKYDSDGNNVGKGKKTQILLITLDKALPLVSAAVSSR